MRFRGSSAFALILALGCLLMAVKFKAAGAVGAVASGNLSLTPPTTATDDIMIVPLTSHDNVALTFPAGWTIEQEGNNTAAMRATVAWKRCSGAEGAFTVTHSAGDCLIGRVFVYSGCVKTGSPIDASSLKANASSSTCTADSITPIDVERLILFSMHDSDDGFSSLQKLNGVNMTERGDSQTALGLDAAISLSELQVYDASPTGSATGTLSLGPDVNVGILIALIPQFGVTQPGGAGTKLYIYHDPFATDTLEFKPIEDLVATFPADAIDKTMDPVSGVQLVVDLQVGDDGDGALLSTLAFTRGFLAFAAGKGLIARGSGMFGATLAKLHLGLPGYTPFTADGNERGTEGCYIALGVAPTTVFGWAEILAYGSKMTAMSGKFELQAFQGEVIDCVFEHLGTGSNDNFSVGHDSLVARRCTFIVATTIAPAVTTWLLEESSEITLIGNPTSFLENDANSIMQTNKMTLRGTPSIADISVVVEPFAYYLVQMTYSGNAPKFSFSVEPPVIDTIVDTRHYQLKVSNKATGAALSGKAAKLVDATGVTTFDELTDADGRIAFFQPHPHYSPAVKPNQAIVRDHYCEADLIAKERPRWPFTLTVNDPLSPDYDKAFETWRQKFDWAGSATGALEDMSMAVELGPPGRELTADMVPLPASGEIRFEDIVPEMV